MKFGGVGGWEKGSDGRMPPQQTYTVLDKVSLDSFKQPILMKVFLQVWQMLVAG